MARRSQCSSAGDNPLDPNYLHPHYREEYRMAIDALVENDLEGYLEFLKSADVVDFLSRLEIEHIQNHVQNPQHADKPPGATGEGDGASGEGSSDTYWPMHSDTDAPSLDLGWPQPMHFFGPTEITTFVNPPDPAMPSIKTQARRLIKDAQLVVAIAMDIFTDVDIFAELLEAATMRNVAVYIILDQQNAHHFTNMVANCRVNLEQIKCMRVRTVAGSTYRCRTGKSIQGQMMNRFLLIDSRAVLGGNYSFMWSYEKLHRCMAHLFLGQLVITFDEEFRILYAQSEPLVMEGVPMAIQKYSSMPELQKPYQPSFPGVKPGLDWPGNPYAGQTEVDARGFPLLRRDSAPGCFPTQPHGFPPQHPSLYPSPQPNIFPPPLHQHHRPGALDRGMPCFQAYGEASSGAGAFYQQYLMHKERQSMDALETQSTHSHRDQYQCERTGREPTYDLFGKYRQRHQHSDQLSEPGGPPGPPGPPMEQVDNYDHMLKFLQSQPSADMGPGLGPGAGLENLPVPEGPYTSSRRRQRSGQSYACQPSPTSPSPHEANRLFMEQGGGERKPKDDEAKKGLRDWRILSYLSAYDDSPSEDQGLDVGDDSPFSSQEYDLDPLDPKMGLRKPPRMPSAFLPSRQKRQVQTDDMKNHPSVQIDAMSGTSESSTIPEDKRAGDGADKQEADANEDLLRKKANPPLQRASRLRNSLLFSSNTEKHRSLFDLAKPKEEYKPEPQEKSSEKTLLKQQSEATVVGEELKPPELALSQLQRSASFMLDVDDADSRLMFFKQLAAQRKAEAMAKSAEEAAEKPHTELGKTGSSALDTSHKATGQKQQTSDTSRKPTDQPGGTDSQPFKATKDKVPIITLHVSDSKSVETLSAVEDITSEDTTAGQAHGVLPQIATDAEKIEQKRLQEPAVAKDASLGPNVKKPLDPATKPAKEEGTAIPSDIKTESPSSIKPVLPGLSAAAAAAEKTVAATKDTPDVISSGEAAHVASTGTAESSGTKKEELVEMRPKPTLQHASRLRNSLLFRSRSEQQGARRRSIPDYLGQDGEPSSAAVDPGSQDKELKTPEDCAATGTPAAEASHQGSAQETCQGAPEAKLGDTSYKRQASFTLGDKTCPVEFQNKVLQRSTAMLDLSDPYCRLRLFRELAAQRKAGQAAAKDAETATGEMSEEPDELKDTSTKEGNVSSLRRSSFKDKPAPNRIGSPDYETANTDGSSGTESFTTAPNSPSTPTPTEFSPLSAAQKESKSAIELTSPASPQPTFMKCVSPQSTSPTEIKSDQSAAKQPSPSRTCAPLKSTEADGTSAAGPLSQTVKYSNPNSALTKSPTGTSYPSNPLTPSCESSTAKTKKECPATKTEVTSPGKNAANCSMKTGSESADSSSPARPTSIAVESPVQSLPAKSNVCSGITPTSPVASNHAALNTDCSSVSSSPMKARPTSLYSPTEPKSPSAVTVTDTSSASASVKSGLRRKNSAKKSPTTPEVSPTKLKSPSCLRKKNTQLQDTTSSLQSKDSTGKSPAASTPETTNTDSVFSFVSSPVKSSPTDVTFPTESKSPTKSPALTPKLERKGSKRRRKGSVPSSPQSPHKDTSTTPAVVAKDTSGHANTSLSPLSSPNQANPTASVTSAEARSSSVTNDPAATSPFPVSKGTLSPQKQDSPVSDLSKEHSGLSNIPETSEAGHFPNPAEREACLSPKAFPTSPRDLKTGVASSLSDATKTDKSFFPTAAETFIPPTSPVSIPSALPVSPGSDTLTTATGQESATEAPLSPVLTVSGGFSPNVQPSVVEPVSAADGSGSYASVIDNGVTERQSVNNSSDTKEVQVSGHASADTAKTSEETQREDLSGATSQIKDPVTSPSLEESEDQTSAAEERAKSTSPASRYQSSTANVISCSNLRDDTKVLLEQISANSQSRQAAKQNLTPAPSTDDAKEEEAEKGANEKGKRTTGSRFQNWESHMTKNERDRLITAMESKRKERRVYSRFEAL
ncbi:protein FAM83H isoform X2 [Engraulis encrasicolus]|uniref:protein FAM83H isoform X2 n=1 Tax=Engraulis encrasicolus TaxID=184585 RepID=UPI002FD3DB01